MELNTSYYFPLPVESLVSVLKQIDTDLFRVDCGIVVQIVPKQ